MNTYLLYISFSAYLTAGILYLLQLIFDKDSLGQNALRLTILAWILQSILLVFRFIDTGYPFLTSGDLSYLFSAWVAATTFLLLNLRYRFSLVGAFILPLISIFYLLAWFSREDYRAGSALMHSPWASVHIIFSFLALAVLAVSFVLGIIFIIEEFQLKYKVSPKLFLRLPSLEAVEQTHAKALTVGFALLSGGIITGAIWAKSVTGVYFFEDARQLWAICAWLIYAFFLQARFAAGWRGRKGVLLSLIGFAVILFTFLGVKHN
ncbi:MAG TPA: cytochrome c biogenesis protein CcsA [bacterium]|nr:cytochrome c biogenesis protein CcsA [bacterium]